MEAEFDRHRETYSADIQERIRAFGGSHGYVIDAKADILLRSMRGLRADGPVRLLDVGCGHGLMHDRLLASEDPRVALTGIDVASTVVDEARRLHPSVAYDVYNGLRLPYVDGAFDAATTVTVMHHVPPAQWPDFLAEMRRVVRPGGLVSVFEHNPYNPVTRHVVNTCALDENAVLLKSAELLALMRDAGLRAPDRDYILFSPFAFPGVRPLERALAWLPLGAQYVAHATV